MINPGSLHERPEEIDVIKFHGDLEHPQSLIFAESGYHRRMQFENPLDILLAATCLRSALLFLGYSLTDMNLRLLWSRVQASMPDPISHAYLCTVGDRHVESDVLGLDKVHVIGLDLMNPTAALTSLLKRLVEEQRNH